MYGYNVRKGELTEEKRRNTIDFVVDYHFMKSVDVINPLEHYISFIHNWYAQKNGKVNV